MAVTYGGNPHAHPGEVVADSAATHAAGLPELMAHHAATTRSYRAEADGGVGGVGGQCIAENGDAYGGKGGEGGQATAPGTDGGVGGGGGAGTSQANGDAHGGKGGYGGASNNGTGGTGGAGGSGGASSTNAGQSTGGDGGDGAVVGGRRSRWHRDDHPPVRPPSTTSPGPTRPRNTSNVSVEGPDKMMSGLGHSQVASVVLSKVSIEMGGVDNDQSQVLRRRSDRDECNGASVAQHGSR